MTLPRNREHDLKRLLDDDGGELGALYRRLPRAEPPRRLDRSVLGEAARAVHGQTPRRHRWMVGFGSAAGLVLAAGVAWHVGQNAMQQQSYDGYRATTPSVVPVEPISESASRKRERENAAQSAAATAAPVPSPAPSLPALAAKVQKAVAPKPVVGRQAAPPDAASPPPAAAPPVAFPAEAADRAELAAPATNAAASAGSVAPQKALDAKEKRADKLDELEPQRSQTGAPPSSSIELRRDMRLAPGDWIAHIEQLLHQGRRQQAIDSLRLFQHVHPDLPVPPELRALKE